MGLTRMEAEIMSRWDNGQPLRQIIRETGQTKRRVERLVQEMHCGPDERRQRLNMTALSDTLLEAITLARAGRITPEPYTGRYPIRTHRTLAEVPACAGVAP